MELDEEEVNKGDLLLHVDTEEIHSKALPLQRKFQLDLLDCRVSAK